MREFTINVGEIVELVEATSENAKPPAPVRVARTISSPRSQDFEDPAILSVGKRPPQRLSPSQRPSPIEPRGSLLSSQLSSQGMERVDSARTVISGSKNEREQMQETYDPQVEKLVEPMQQTRITEVEADVIPEVVVSHTIQIGF